MARGETDKLMCGGSGHSPAIMQKASMQKALMLGRVLTGVAGLLLSSMANAAAATADADQCRALVGRTFILAGDTPAVVGTARPVAANAGLPAHCAVEGYVAPQVGFEIRLPMENWNGRYLQQGCRGMCGFLNSGLTDDALARGYATASTDMGHKAINSTSGLWAVDNPQGKIDYGHRATHVTAEVADAVIEAFYGAAARKKYFRGCGTGGRQALVEAQRYPSDFDGIAVNGGIVFNFTRLNYLMAWSVRANLDSEGRQIMSEADTATLHRGALNACDGADGRVDGVISYPEVCSFNPASLVCRPGQTDDCLTVAKVATAQKMYAGPSRTNGEVIYPGMALGSEKKWASAFFGANPRYAHFSVEMMRYFLFPTPPGPRFELKDFDLDKPVADFTETERLVSADATDYAGFRARNGKLLVIHGWNESAMPGTYPPRYVRRLAEELGTTAALKDFFRFYMVPGEMHCAAGVPEGRHFDVLTALERWVEAGEAPDTVQGFALKTDPKFPNHARFLLDPANIEEQRPYAPYPERLIYRGKGDTSDLKSYRRLKN